MRAGPLLFLTAALLGSAPASADAVLDALKAEASAQGQRPFERTVTVETPGKPTVVRVDRYDPKAAEGKRWVLVSVDGRAPTADEVKAHQGQVAGTPVPGFQRLHLLLAGKPSAIEQRGAQRVYRWASLQKGAVKTGQGPDFSEKLSAEAFVDVADGAPARLDRVRIYAAEPFGIMGVARMNRFEAVSRYERAEAGHRLASQVNEVDARVPFRSSGAVRTEARFRPL